MYGGPFSFRIAARHPRAGDALGSQAGDCGRSDDYAGAGDKPPSNRLLGVSANFRFPLTVCLPESARARLIVIFLKQDLVFPGRSGRARTCDPRFWRPVLYQLSYTPTGRESPSFGTGLPWTPGWPVSRDGSSPGAHAAPAFNAATTHEMQEARRDGDRLSAPILPRLYSPSSLNDGWSAGRGPSGQWYFRSDSLIGRSLMLAMRKRIRPCSSNSQFSLP